MLQSMGYSRKNPHPHEGRHAEKFSQEGQLTALEIHTGGVFERKNTSSGVSFDFTDVSIASIDKKKKLLCIFQFYYSFKLQTSYHIYSKFPSIGSPSLLLSAFVAAMCDNLKISRKIT